MSRLFSIMSFLPGLDLVNGICLQNDTVVHKYQTTDRADGKLKEKSDDETVPGIRSGVVDWGKLHVAAAIGAARSRGNEYHAFFE